MKKKKPKQIAALLCVVLLISLYVVTFLVACFGSVDSGQLFAAWALPLPCRSFSGSYYGSMI